MNVYRRSDFAVCRERVAANHSTNAPAKQDVIQRVLMLMISATLEISIRTTAARNEV